MPKVSEQDTISELTEQAWIRGHRAAFAQIFSKCAGELGIETTEGKLAALCAERERTVAALRKVCAEHGSNDWPDNMHLADVVEKHLGRHLDAHDDAEEGSEP